MTFNRMWNASLLSRALFESRYCGRGRLCRVALDTLHHVELRSSVNHFAGTKVLGL